MAISISGSPLPDVASTGTITVRGVILGVLSIAGMSLYITHYGGALIKSYLPVAIMVPFLMWVVGNCLLKMVMPSLALTRVELLTILSMMWIIGNLPAIGWAQYNISSIVGVSFLASPENRLGDFVLPHLPKWLFLDASRPEIRQAFTGLQPNGSIPWLSWLRPQMWWLVGSLPVIMATYFASTILFRQWDQNERLVFPMSAFPVALVEEREGERFPAIFTERMFWLGFTCVAGVYVWNFIGYWWDDYPTITIFGGARSKALDLGKDFRPYFFRIQPMIMGLSFLCPTDILFSFAFYNVFDIWREGTMNRFGFSVGLRGQAAGAKELTMLEAHGVLVLLVAWSLWIARFHIRDTIQKAVSGDGDDGVPVSYRTAWTGFVLSGLIFVSWCLSAGLTFFAALLQTGLMFVAFFGVSKYAAQTGFTFLNSPGRKGGDIILSLVGTNNLSPASTSMLTLMNRHTFLGQARRLAAVPSIPHFFRMIGKGLRREGLVGFVLPLAYIVGFFLTSWIYIHVFYHEGGLNGRFSGLDVSYLVGRVSLIAEERVTYFDYAKIWAWVWGVGLGGILIYLRGRFAWWPLHPAAFAFPTSYYAFSIFLTWLAKAVIIRFWGVLGYRKAMPFAFGMVAGYLFGVGADSIIDLTFFPDGGHWVHGW
jgi:hypothetical protein